MTNRSMTIYLAGPIDGMNRSVVREWREEAGRECPEGVLLFSPAHAYFGASPSVARELHSMNCAVIYNSEALIANLTWGLTLGTAREIEFARREQKPVAVIAPGGMRGSLMSYDLSVCETFGGALVAVMEAVNEHRNAPQSFLGLPIGRLVQDDDEEEED